VVKIPPIANLQTVMPHSKKTTVLKTNDRNMTEKQANASAKSKELQPNAQSQRFAAHLLLPQPHRQSSTNTITENRKNN
jgi:hypothetical protein